MTAHHEGFADFDACALANDQQRFGLGDSKADRLFAENMLACLCSFDRPGNMKLIGKRIVDCINMGISNEFFVRTVRRRNSEIGRGLLGFRKVP